MLHQSICTRPTQASHKAPPPSLTDVPPLNHITRSSDAAPAFVHRSHSALLGIVYPEASNGRLQQMQHSNVCRIAPPEL